MIARNLARMALVVALAVCWCLHGAVAQSQQDDTSTFRDQQQQTGLIPGFPFTDCATKVGAYRLAPDIKSLGGGKFCFTIKVQDTLNCSNACCSADLAKIEFNVSSSCMVSPAAVIPATLNGKPTRVGASFDRPVNGRPGTAILRLTQLGLNTATARDAELCITLRPNTAGQGCTTLEQLCATQPGAPAGTCSAAMYDTACDCCPVSRASTNPPSSPPPSPSPSPSPILPPAYRFCDTCIYSSLVPPITDPWPYRYDVAACLSIQQQISASLNAVVIQNNVSMTSYFAPNASFCSGTVVGTCGVFNATPAQMQTLNAALAPLLPAWLDISSGGDLCRPELSGYKVQVDTGISTCLTLTQSASCNLPPSPPPFPNCTCNTSQNILPFIISPRYFPLAPSSNKSTTTEYCFPITTISTVVPSSCATGNDTLYKITWYANQNLSSMVRGFNLYPATGPATRLSSSWGAQGTSTLKATGINWSPTQAHGGMVCVELKNPAKMEDLCLGPEGGQQLCYVSAFNSNLNCCPTYRSEPVPPSRA